MGHIRAPLTWPAAVAAFELLEVTDSGLARYRAQSTACWEVLTNTGTRRQPGDLRTLVSMVIVWSRMFGGVMSI